MGNGEGETGMGKRGGVKVLARVGSGEGETWRVRLGGGHWEGEGAMGRGRWGGGNRKGEMWKWAKGRGEKLARGEGISQMDMMKSLDGMRL